MRYTILAYLCCLAVAALLFTQRVEAAPRYRTDRVILLPKRNATPDALKHLHGAKGRRILKSYQALGGLQVVQLAQGEDLGEALVRYRASGEVYFAEPDFKLRALAAPDDPEFTRGSQWPLYNTGQSGGTAGSDIDAVAGW